MMDHQENKERDQGLDHQEKQTHENNDSTFKKAAMATFGAISDAVEKVAGAIDNAASPENIDKYAKKGEESLKGVKDASEGIFKQVKDFSGQAIQKVKGTIGIEDLHEYKDIPSAREALAQELKELQTSAEQAQERLKVTTTEDEFDEYQNQVAGELSAHQSKVDALIKHIKKFHEEERKEKEKAEKELKKETQEEVTNETKEEIESDTAHVDIPGFSEVPYDTNHYPRSVYDRREHGAADYEKASQVAPDRDNNTVVLETDSRNDHLDQSWPVEMG